MEQVYFQANMSMFLLKIVGLLLLFTGISYYFICRPVFVPQWKSVIKIGCMLGLLNAGFVITLGKDAFPLTPFILIICTCLYYFNKFPLYKSKHLLCLLVSFVFSSGAVFIGIAGTFFHLAVEGKI